MSLKAWDSEMTMKGVEFRATGLSYRGSTQDVKLELEGLRFGI